MEKKKLNSLVVILIILLFGVFSTTNIVTDLYWFKSMDADKVFWTIFNTKLIVWFVIFIVSFGFIYSNLWIALFSTRNQKIHVNPEWFPGVDFNKIIKSGVFFASFALAMVTSVSGGNLWEEFLNFLHNEKFEINDPVFNNDIGFYFFTLPFLLSVKNILIGLIIEAIIASGIIYFFKGSIQLIKGWYNNFGTNVRRHLGGLVILLLLLFSLHFILLRYELLYSRSGVVYGAGHTDIHSRLWGYYIVSMLMAVVSLFIIYYIFSRKTRPLVFSVLGLTGSFFLLIILIPGFEQKFLVEPNELEREKEYIEYGLEFTRKSYGLDQIKKEEYHLNNVLTKKDLLENKTTFHNIRLWDWRPLLNTYKQLQELRMYYTFEDVDVDRYYLNNEYRQLMLSARELNYDQMPIQARTWVNQRIRYTHGYGVVASPVDVVTKEGMPEFVLKDIPPIGPEELRIDRPGIYYGERTRDYIFTGTSMEEFDYPLGETNKHTRYNGKGGVSLNSFWKRLLYAIDNKSIKILISEYFTSETKILYNRNILTIAEKLGPFLTFDSDPYIVIVEGKLKWIIDAYTTGSRYPYSQPVERNINYIRNSIKVVIDAYDGEADFYILDETDPVLKVYEKIFPGFFKKNSEIPNEIRSHFRYPIDIFVKQSQIYLAYHMNEPEVFYNREDLWKFPKEIYQGQEETMVPYFTMMQLKGGEAEFLLFLPFTPANKNNMIAWMSAGSDGKNYGKLNLYEFPKQELVYGPMQIEARINQTPEISEVLTLWSQQGSSVIRGNLLVIPINHTLLYVEPLYLQADKSKMPELKRVIVGYKNQIIMKPTLDEALERIFNVSNLSSGESGGIETDIKSLINKAVTEFQKGNEALQKGDWGRYGMHQKEVEKLLREIQKETVKK
jgi:hypothetical protein